MNAYFSKRKIKKASYSDLEILNAIRNTLEEDRVLEFLYASVKNSLYPFILSNNGSTDDADDVLQDAIIVFYEKVKSKEFRLQTTIAGYIFTVGKYIWLNKLKKQKKETPLSNENIEDIGIAHIDIEQYAIDISEYTKAILDSMQEGCKKILIDSIYKKMSMNEIAIKYGFKNEQVARNKKHKCLKSLRINIEKSSYFSKILKEITI